MFSDAGYLGDEVLGRFGALAARLSAALADFEHPAADRDLQYDSRHAERVVDTLAGSVSDPARRADAVGLSERAWAALTPLTEELRGQVVHADLADYNVVAARDDAGRLTPTGRDRLRRRRPVLAGGRSGHRDHLAAGAEPSFAGAGRRRRGRRLPRRDPADRGRDRRASGPWWRPGPACWPSSVDDILAADPDNAYAREEQPLDWLILDRAAAVPFPLAEVILRQRGGVGLRTPRSGGRGMATGRTGGRPAAAGAVPGLLGRLHPVPRVDLDRSGEHAGGAGGAP